jgi:hypothetical protein
MLVTTASKQSIVMVNFLVVDRPSAYDSIVGRSTLNKLWAVTSTHHLKMKFPTNNRVGETNGDQLTARKCYNTTVKVLKDKETILVGMGFRNKNMQ